MEHNPSRKEQRMQVEKTPNPATLDAVVIEHHNARHPEELSPDGWTDEWVCRVLLAPSRVRPSLQEAQALKNWARAQR
jgi:hypothetical protein